MSKRAAEDKEDPFNFEVSEEEGTQSDTEQFVVQGNSLVSKRQCVAAFPVSDTDSPDVVAIETPVKLDEPTPTHATRPGAVLIPSLLVHAGDAGKVTALGDEVSGPGGSKWALLAFPNGRGSTCDDIGGFLKVTQASACGVTGRMTVC
jgi:hypothetical protein